MSKIYYHDEDLIPGDVDMFNHPDAYDQQIELIWAAILGERMNPVKFMAVLKFFSVEKQEDKIALMEWTNIIALQSTDNNGTFCICSKYPIRFLYFIRNNKNGNILRVGSDCILKHINNNVRDQCDFFEKQREKLKEGVPALRRYLQNNLTKYPNGIVIDQAYINCQRCNKAQKSLDDFCFSCRNTARREAAVEKKLEETIDTVEWLAKQLAISSRPNIPIYRKENGRVKMGTFNVTGLPEDVKKAAVKMYNDVLKEERYQDYA